MQNRALGGKIALGGSVIFEIVVCFLSFSFIPVHADLKLCAHCLGGHVRGKWVLGVLSSKSLIVLGDHEGFVEVKLLRDIWVSRNGKRRGCFSTFFWREKPRGKGMGGLGRPVDSEKTGDLPTSCGRWRHTPVCHYRRAGNCVQFLGGKGLS